MDWSGLVRETFGVMRRGQALWKLALVSAIQAGLYAVLMGAVIVPMTLLTQVLAQTGSSTSPLPPEFAATYLPQVLAWFSANASAIVGGVVVLMLLWAASGVFDVAATAGSISQTSALAESRDASFSQGVHDGFRVWWRTIGVLALAAVPALISLVGVAAATVLTVTIPIAQGHAPSVVAIGAGNAMNSLLSTVAGIVGIPLGVIAQLGLRYVVLDDMQPKRAWVSGWRLAKTRLVDVVLMYLLQAGVALAGAFAFAIVFGTLAGVLAITLAVLGGSAGSFSGAMVSVSAVGALLLLGVGLAFSVMVLLWQSVVWTLFWRRATGVEPTEGHAGPAYPEHDVR